MDPKNVTTPSPAPPKPHHEILSTAARAGIGIGIGMTTCLLFVAVLYLLRLHKHSRKHAKPASSQGDSESSVELHGFSRAAVIEMPADPGRIWEQEPKSLLGMGGLEPKSLWVQRQTMRRLP